jgi:hypothetical protein
MLWQGRDSLQRLRIARPPPVDLELEAVELPPLTNETEGALRERILRVSMAIVARCSAYPAWKCGRPCSRWYIAITMP